MHSGQKVKCIKGFSTSKYIGCQIPVVGHVYHLRDFDGCDGWRLEEVRNPIGFCVHDVTHEYSVDEPSFNQSHFQPITDISALQRLTKVRELEDA